MARPDVREIFLLYSARFDLRLAPLLQLGPVVMPRIGMRGFWPFAPPELRIDVPLIAGPPIHRRARTSHSRGTSRV